MTVTQSQFNSHGKSDKTQTSVVEPIIDREMNQRFTALIQTFEKIRAIQSACQRQFNLLNSAKPHGLTKPEIKQLYTDWLKEQEG